ncbi:ABC transporter ATP-binding protein [Metabacillus malikii]|uniref:ABC-2 type transport system ATP-binding protein n=1 Tax=Metabacillus malikii TaxID=1504265 RepID=A0ABT9ZG34_9BACI|nr:ABC transporter ATP-binding protein [Metabacillus malikii]MDQ0231209.1 ABC-2 type transport system ATP-binding protein [Metabacillus malikii]
MEILNVSIEEAGYEDKKSVIKEVNFSLQPGELIGIIGPNGAGKSTTIKTLLGVIEYVKGDIQKQKLSTYAYIPERPIFYDHLTLWEHLDLLAAINEIDDETLEKMGTHYLEIFKMDKVKHDMPATFSKGMQQKAMIIQALLLKPDYYIVDEPFIGLDPSAIKKFISLMEEEKQRGAGILMSTHVLDTAEKICDRFLLISNGTIFAQGTLNDIQAKSGLHDGSLLDCFYLMSEGGSNE